MHCEVESKSKVLDKYLHDSRAQVSPTSLREGGGVQVATTSATKTKPKVLLAKSALKIINRENISKHIVHQAYSICS